jgi:hypothetical protein
MTSIVFYPDKLISDAIKNHVYDQVQSPFITEILWKKKFKSNYV